MKRLNGMTRPMDKLGRIVIPKEIRDANGIEEGDLLRIEISGNGILLAPIKKCCQICGSESNLTEADGIAICRKCAAQIFTALEGKK